MHRNLHTLLDAKRAALQDAEARIMEQQQEVTRKTREHMDKLAEESRKKAIENAMIEWTNKDFCKRESTEVRARSNRFCALKRCLTLAGNAVNPDRMRNFALEFSAWDHREASRDPKGSSGADHANRFAGQIKKILELLHRNRGWQVAQWWENTMKAFGALDVILPSAN